MMRLAFTAIKYFSLGLLLGVLTAPRSGVASRQMLRENGLSAIKSVLPSFGDEQTAEGTRRVG